jgi:hypothetical protein
MTTTVPQRSPQGVSTYPPRHILKNFPVTPNDFQVVKSEDFDPYRSGDYTVTSTNGTIAQLTTNSGGISMSTSGGSTSDESAIALERMMQFIPGNRLYADFRIAFPTANNDVNMYAGLFDTTDPSAAANGVYFVKPAGGSTVNLIILKGGTSTTFQNVADLSLPSGVYSDPNSSAATLSFTVSGGNYSAPVITAPGNGYRVAPLILATGATGSGATLVGVLGGSAVGAGPGYNTNSTQLPYSPLANVFLTNVGNGAYTTATTTITPWINLQLYYTGSGSLYVGVNGQIVCMIGGNSTGAGVIGVSAGSTVNVATKGPSFNVASVLASTNFVTGLATGDVYNILPLGVLYTGMGIKNTTANARLMYVSEYNICTEFN